VPTIRFSSRFTKAYAKLPPHLQHKIDKALRLLANDPRHPSLQTKPVQSARGVYEARVDQSYRLTYERLPGDILKLRVVGRHDETLKNP